MTERIPGEKAAHAFVADECINRYGGAESVDDAIKVLRKEAAEIVKRWEPDMRLHFVLTLEREP
jgi:hypothetical protein